LNNEWNKNPDAILPLLLSFWVLPGEVGGRL